MSCSEMILEVSDCVKKSISLAQVQTYQTKGNTSLSAGELSALLEVKLVGKLQIIVITGNL